MTTEIETVIGTQDDDVIDRSYLLGPVVINALTGNDTITTGSGDDTITAGDGDDVIDAGLGVDSIDAGAGNDMVKLDTGIANGGTGNDTLTVSNKGIGHVTTVLNGVLHGGEGDDMLMSESFNGSTFYGDQGNDTIVGFGSLYGSAGNDIIITPVAIDNIISLPPKSYLYGGAGDDLLRSNAVSLYHDVLNGGSGNDTYLFNNDDISSYITGEKLVVINNQDGDTDSVDIVRLINGIQPSHVTIARANTADSYLDDTLITDSSDLVLSLPYATTIVIKNMLDGDTLTSNAIDAIEFEDGTVWDQSYILSTLLGTNVLQGTEGDDVLVGEDSGQIIDAFGGDDTINAGAGNDTITGGDGDDVINSGAGINTIDAGAGNDSIKIYGSSGTLLAGDGNDTVEVSAVDGVYDAGNGDDFVDFVGGYEGGSVLVQGGDGSDTITGIFSSANDTVEGGAGDDSITLHLYGLGEGGEGNDTLYTSSNASLYGGDGNDSIASSGRYGNTLDGGEGSDTITGGEGNDFILGGGDDDSLFGGEGNDYVVGGDGNDVIDSGAGNDTVVGGSGNDRLLGADGDDNLNGFEGNDTIYGGAGNDRIHDDLLAQAGGDDFIDGGEGNDTIITDDGNDTVYGGLGDDSIQVMGSGAGINVVDGGDGNDFISNTFSSLSDSLHGGAGNDVLQASGNVYGGEGNDTITGIGQLYGGDGDDIITTSDPLDHFEINQQTYAYGGAGDDQLRARSGSILEHSDVLNGGAGNDTYLFGSVEESVFINNEDSDAGSTDVLRFIDGISPDDVTISRAIIPDLNDPTNPLPISLSPNDVALCLPFRTIVLQNMLDGDTLTSNAIDAIEFEDGTVWDQSYILSTLLGTNVLQGTEGDDVLVGEDSGQIIDAFGGDDTINAGAGNDTITALAGDDVINAGAGDDQITIGNGDHVVNAGFGNDDIVVEHTTSGHRVSVNADQGDDRITSASVFSAGDILDGGAGNDTIHFTGLNGTLRGGTEDDVYELTGAAGHDTITTDTFDYSSDTIRFVDAAHEVTANNTSLSRVNDDLVIHAGPDKTITLQAYFSRINVSNSNIKSIEFTDGSTWNLSDIAESLYGSTENSDILTGYDDFGDRINTGAGNDVINGLGGGDSLGGGDGDDTINGGAGNDSLYGGSHNDALNGGTGNDYLAGNTGNDTYTFSADFGQDRLVNNGATFDVDVVRFEFLTIDDIWFSHSNNDLVITEAGTTNQVTLVNWFAANPVRVDQIEAGGRIIFIEGINQLVDAMSAYPVPLGVDIAPADLAQLYVAINTSWQSEGSSDQADNYQGTSGNDIFNGFGGDDVINGEDGDDHLQGGPGKDRIGGGKGDDTIDGGIDDDLLLGGDGEDLLAGGEGDDSIYAGVGDDTVSGQEGNDFIGGSNGDDELNGNAGDDLVEGGNGDDLLNGGAGNDFLAGNVGNDTYVFNGDFGQDRVSNGGGAFDIDVLKITDVTASNVWFSQQGNDLLITVAGTDNQITVIAWFDSSNKGKIDLLEVGGEEISPSGVQALVDAMSAYPVPLGEGNNIPPNTASELAGVMTLHYNNPDQPDIFQGTHLDDVFNGFGGDDELDGGKGNDTFLGGDGSDRLYGGDGNDILSGEADNDLLLGGNGDDHLSGGSGSDKLFAGIGDDTLSGGSGNDFLGGSNGIDFLYGGEGDDFLGGGNGDDYLVGEYGNDGLSGNAGNDTYFFSDAFGHDTIRAEDSTGDVDVINFADVVVNDLWFSQAGDDLLVTSIGTDNSVLVEGWYAAGDTRTEQFVSGDSILAGPQVDQLVQAMSVYAVPVNTGSLAELSSLQTVIDDSWV